MRRMNSMLDGHQGASARTPRIYLSIASWTASSFHDSGRCTMRDGTSMSPTVAELVFDRLERGDQVVERQRARVVVDLQRADAGRQVDDAGEACRRLSTRLHQRVRAEAQREIEDDRPVLDQEIGVAGAAVDDARRLSPAASRPPTMQSSLPHLPCGHRRRARRTLSAAISASCFASAAAASAGVRRVKRTLSPGRSWPIFHSSACTMVDRADEAAERRAVGAEDHRHVAGEIDGADGIGVVVDVARMQSRLAAVGARPAGLGTDQADAGRIGIVVHLPVGGEERVDVVRSEEVRRAVRTVEHADLPRHA